MNQSFQDSKHKFIALYYGGFSIFATCILIYLIDFNNINLFSKLIYGLMLTQLIITLYAAYQYWQLNITGLKILKCISFSSVSYTHLDVYKRQVLYSTVFLKSIWVKTAVFHCQRVVNNQLGWNDRIHFCWITTLVCNRIT